MAASTLGAVIRGIRCAMGLSQAHLGALCGYSASAISRIERGLMRMDAERLPLFATALPVPVERLSAALPPPPTRPGTVIRRDEEDEMRRRDLLAGAVTASLATAVGASAARASAPAVVPLEEALFQLPGAAPVPLDGLARATEQGRAAFRAAAYDDLARRLPVLLSVATATRDAATGRARDRANVLLARAYILGSELSSKQHSDAAWVTADRALTAARHAGHPVPIAESARVLAIAMRRSGRAPAAVRFLTCEAAALDGGHPSTASVRTAMLLTAAYTAAQYSDRTSALDLLGQVDAETERLERTSLPSAGLFTHDVTRAQVDVYRVGVLTALGTPDEAVAVVRRLDVARMPSPERRARAWTDVARMWHAQGDHPRALAALRHVAAEAPQEVRRPALRALVGNMLYASSPAPGVRDFAARHGALT